MPVGAQIANDDQREALPEIDFDDGAYFLSLL